MAAWSESLVASTPGDTAYLLALLVGCIAAFTDLARRTIPNVLTYLAIAAGLILGAMAGWTGLRLSAAGFLGLGIPMAVLFQYGALGGGDVKLVSAFGALLGFERGVEIVLAGAVLTAVLLSLAWARTAILALTRRRVREDRKPAGIAVAGWTFFLLALPSELLAASVGAFNRLREKRVAFAPGLALAVALSGACDLRVLGQACRFGMLHLRS